MISQPPPNTTVRYKGQTFISALPDFLTFKVMEPNHVVAGYVFAVKTGLPYIIQDGDALFVNGEISFKFKRRGMAWSDVTGL